MVAAWALLANISRPGPTLDDAPRARAPGIWLDGSITRPARIEGLWTPFDVLGAGEPSRALMAAGALAGLGDCLGGAQIPWAQALAAASRTGDQQSDLAERGRPPEGR